MGKLRNNKWRRNGVIILFWLMLVFAVFGIIVNYLEYQILWHYRSQVSIRESTNNLNDMLRAFQGLGLLLLNILLIVFFLLWFYRSYTNLTRVSSLEAKSDHVFAIGSWFIPFVNLVYPCVLMMELWKKMQISKKGVIGSNYKEPPTLIGWWWGGRIVHSFFWLFSFGYMAFASMPRGRYYYYAPNYDMLMNSKLFGIFAYIIQLVVLILAIVMFTKMGKFENDFYEKHQEVDLLDNLIDDD